MIQLVILNFQEANRVKTLEGAVAYGQGRITQLELENKKVKGELEAERAITAKYRQKAKAWEVEKK